MVSRSDRNAADLIQSDLVSNSVQNHHSSPGLNNVNTLQQQLVQESSCGVGSSDPKCNPGNYQINVGGFLPMSTTPNIVSSTVIFTSPRSVEKIQQHLSSGNINQPKEILLQILDAQQQKQSPAFKMPRLPPQQSFNPRNGRKKFGARLEANTNRFAHFFGARKRRDTSDGVEIRNVFADKETVNMIKGFQVVSASDLAFNPETLTQLMDVSGDDGEICFNETSFYAALLIGCSLLIISGLVSVCSIRKIRKYQHKAGVKRMFFGGDTCSTIERYH